jgi:AraC-like DNA-binding protein
MGNKTRNRPQVATIRVRNFLALREVLIALGADPAQVLVSAGMDPGLFSDPERAVAFGELDRLLTECLKTTQCEDVGLRVGEIGGAEVIGLAGLVSLNCATVREGMRTIVDGLKTTNTGGAVILDEVGGVALLGYAVVAPGVENGDQIIDCGMARLMNVMQGLCGPEWRPDRVLLTRRPPRDVASFARFFQAPVEFDAASARLEFDAAILDWPIKDHNPAHREILVPLLDRALAEAPDEFVFAVKSVLRAQAAAGRLTRERICRAMGLSKHTLTSRLKASGVTFAKLADETLLELAESLLLKGRPISEVSVALGFADKSAFTRAFKKWAGTTPARWRSRRAASTPVLLDRR